MKVCQYCAEQIQDAAKICRFCQRDLPAAVQPTTTQPEPVASTPRRLSAKLAIAFVVAAALAGLGFRTFLAEQDAEKYFAAPAHSDTPLETATSISIGDLLDAYAANEIAADRRFKDQAVLVTGGHVAEIGRDVRGLPYLILRGWERDDHMAVQAFFDTSNENALANLSEGTPLSVQCHGMGKLFNVMLKDCILR